MSAKGSYDKGLVPRVALVKGGRIFKRWRLVGSPPVIGDVL